MASARAVDDVRHGSSGSKNNPFPYNGEVRVLLVSTYDLGRQPFGLASPAAWLRAAGVDVSCADASRDPDLRTSSSLAHQSSRSTCRCTRRPAWRHRSSTARAESIRRRALCAYGLYAPAQCGVASGAGVADVLGPEAEGELVALVTSLGTPHKPADPGSDSCAPGRADDCASSRPIVQACRRSSDTRRCGCPTAPDASSEAPMRRAAASICAAIARLCRFTKASSVSSRVDVVMEDVRAQVAAGAQHISFGDPDFLNGPTHARHIVERVSAEFPGLSYDVTIKIEHLLKHADDDAAPPPRPGACSSRAPSKSIDDVRARPTSRRATREAISSTVVRLCRDAGVTLVPTFVTVYTVDDARRLSSSCSTLLDEAGSRRAGGTDSARHPSAGDGRIAAA